jgi:hypothetical protein
LAIAYYFLVLPTIIVNHPQSRQPAPTPSGKSIYRFGEWQEIKVDVGYWWGRVSPTIIVNHPQSRQPAPTQQ